MKKIVLKIIRLYQKNYFWQKLFNHVFFLTDSFCRFQPTCSEYNYQAIEKYGIIKGGFLGLQRILKCNPWHKGGKDPLR